jgi:hypothetical protein
MSDLKTSSPTLSALVEDRPPGTCAICGRKLRAGRRNYCARADCQTEMERLYQADRRERKRSTR